MVADLSHATKTCQCGNKIQLAKAPRLGEARTADTAAELLRSIMSNGNSGFHSAKDIAGFSLTGSLEKKR